MYHAGGRRGGITFLYTTFCTYYTFNYHIYSGHTFQKKQLFKTTYILHKRLLFTEKKRKGEKNLALQNHRKEEGKTRRMIFSFFLFTSHPFTYTLLSLYTSLAAFLHSVFFLFYSTNKGARARKRVPKLSRCIYSLPFFPLRDLLTLRRSQRRSAYLRAAKQRHTYTTTGSYRNQPDLFLSRATVSLLLTQFAVSILLQ